MIWTIHFHFCLNFSYIFINKLTTVSMRAPNQLEAQYMFPSPTRVHTIQSQRPAVHFHKVWSFFLRKRQGPFLCIKERNIVLYKLSALAEQKKKNKNKRQTKRRINQKRNQAASRRTEGVLLGTQSWTATGEAYSKAANSPWNRKHRPKNTTA
jgi:hypothetical protein